MRIRKTTFLSIMLLVLISMLFYRVYQVVGIINSFSVSSKGIIQEEGKVPEVLNILVSGLDSTGENGSRPGNSSARSDVILLLSINIPSQSIQVISIPRDTRAEIAGYGQQKINHSRHYGGIFLLMDTVSKLIEVDIDYYLEADFTGFKVLVDEIGGVFMTIDKELKDTLTEPPIIVPAGTYNLNGEQALGLIRFRNYPLGDIDRIKMQQEFFKALVKELAKPKRLLQLRPLSQVFYQYVTTDITYNNFFNLILSLRNFSLDDASFHTLPGKSSTTGGISYWRVGGEEFEKFKQDYIYRR